MSFLIEKIKDISISKIGILIGWIFIVTIIGIMITGGKWLYIGAITLIPLMIYFFIKLPFLFFFGLYASLIPLDSVLLITAGHSLTKYLAILIILVLFLKGISEKKFIRPDTIVIWLILLSFYSMLTIVWAIDSQLSLNAIRNVVALPIFYLIVSSYKVHGEDYDKLKWFIIGGGFLTALMEMYSYKTILQSAANIDRVAIVLGDQASSLNTLAFSLLIPVSTVFGKILQEREKIRKLFLIIVLVLTLFGIILTGSRGGMLGAGVIFLVFFLSSRKKVTLFSFVTTVFIIIISLAPSFFIERWLTAFETGGAGRTVIWKVGLISLQKYWITGAGLNNFPAAYTEFSEYASRYVGINRAPHNIYLGLFVELGIVGIMLMLIAFVKHYRAIDKAFNSSRYDVDSIVLMASFWAILTSSFFLDTFWDKPLWLLWMLIMIRKNALRQEANFYAIRNKSLAILST